MPVPRHWKKGNGRTPNTQSLIMRRFIGRMFARAANLFGVNPSVWAAIGGMRGIGLSAAGVQVTPEAALNIAAYKRAVDLGLVGNLVSNVGIEYYPQLPFCVN